MEPSTPYWRQPVRFIRRLLIRPHYDVRAALWFWGVLAAVCLAAGVLVADNPGRSDAYFEVRRWLQLWMSGVNVYEVPKLFVDYPPHALVFLRPMMLIPANHGEVWFALFNVGVCAATAWILVSQVSGYAGVTLSRVERLAYVFMLLVWSPTRVGIWNGQTSPFLILCCCLALRFAATRPLLAGLCMGIGLSKPHVAFGFFLFAAFLRRWTMLVTSVVAVIAAEVVYMLTVARSPMEVLSEYADTLFAVYGGSNFLRAEVDIRPFFTDLIGNYAIAEPLFVAVASVLGAMLLWLTWRVRNNLHAGVWVLASGLTWAMAVFPFRRYGMLLLAPTVLLLLWRRTLSERMLTGLGALIILIALDLPFTGRHLLTLTGTDTANHFGPMLHYVHRAITVLCLTISMMTLARMSPTDSALRPA